MPGTRPPRGACWWWHGFGKSLWLVTVLARWEARSATEATVESSAAKSRNQGAKIPEGRRRTGRRASIGMRDGAARGTPYTYRRKKKRKNYRRECTGSALVPMWVGMSAELGRHGCGGWWVPAWFVRPKRAGLGGAIRPSGWSDSPQRVLPARLLTRGPSEPSRSNTPANKGLPRLG